MIYVYLKFFKVSRQTNFITGKYNFVTLLLDCEFYGNKSKENGILLNVVYITFVQYTGNGKDEN